MSYIKIQGIVLKNMNLGESDKIITLLSDKLGKVDAVAHGSRKGSSSLMASTQPFCYGEYMLYKGKNLYTLSQSSIIESFQQVLLDFQKLMYGTYYLELTDNLVIKDVKNISMLALLIKTLYILINGDVDDELLKAAVNFKAISISGYMPEINCCVKCGNIVDSGYFSIENGGMVCFKCKDKEYHYGINKDTLQILHTLKNIKLEDLRNIKYDRKNIEYVDKIITSYIIYYSEKDLKSLKILNQIKNKE